MISESLDGLGFFFLLLLLCLIPTGSDGQIQMSTEPIPLGMWPITANGNTVLTMGPFTNQVCGYEDKCAWVYLPLQVCVYSHGSGDFNDCGDAIQRPIVNMETDSSTFYSLVWIMGLYTTCGCFFAWMMAKERTGRIVGRRS